MSMGCSFCRSLESAFRSLDQSIENYHLKNGEYPESLSDLTSGDPPTVRTVIRDPWGKPFIYEDQGESYELRSSGPDGVSDTDDDFVSGEDCPVLVPGEPLMDLALLGGLAVEAALLFALGLWILSRKSPARGSRTFVLHSGWVLGVVLGLPLAALFAGTVRMFILSLFC
ncbi:MAG: type II secretion system protein GspG [Myxococcota bacterium]